MFADAASVIRGAAAALAPPQRLRVSDGATKLHVHQPGGYNGPWSAAETPYMVEPMDMLASRRHEAVCFIGPARSGKTMGLLDAWVAHIVTSDPGDMLIVQMTQDKARDYSKTRIDRAIRHSPELSALMSKHGHDDNTHDKIFRNGMWLKIGWPTATQLASSDYRYVAMTDYDRMPDDIDGEGSAYQLGLKRTTTFLSRGMCMLESSPARPITDPNWSPATPHEGPPCDGIVGIYNRSDRRRLYWPCPECGEFFQARPGLSDFVLIPPEAELLDKVRTADLSALAKEYARIGCPHCGSLIDAAKKTQMVQGAQWLRDGETINAKGERGGTPMESTIAGYWLGGVAATYQNWTSLVSRYLQGLREYVLTGSELSLQGTTNTDQGSPYLSRHLARQAAKRSRHQTEPLPRFIVPDQARFVVATVDVQGGSDARFVVQVHAHGPHHEQWLVDRYSITHTVDQDDEPAAIDPASRPEDWKVLTERVISATYRTSTEGRELRVLRTAVDTGGEDGVTENAYAWYRGLGADQGRVILIKGASSRASPIYRLSRVGGKKAGSGDVPLYLLNTNLLKDAVSNCLKRQEPGPGFLHFPDWLTAPFFDEMESEVREPSGNWRKVRKRNEAFDLCAYQRAVAIILGVDQINWDHPPAWAKPLDANSEALTSGERRQMKTGTAPVKSGAFKRTSFTRR